MRRGHHTSRVLRAMGAAADEKASLSDPAADAEEKTAIESD
jgi:hypothetical protein